MLSSPLSWIARAAAACAAALMLASCGGGVSANPSPLVDSATLTILPATATMYSGLPTTFVLSGGTGAYIVTSSDQAILPISGGVTGRSVTLAPNPVIADTTVTLTLRDTGSAAPVSATVVVRPGTVNNNITLTPGPGQPASCSPGICSGGDAEVKVTISQGGIPLAARGVRFEVVSGSFSFITSAAGVTPERLETAAVTATDETGIARARIRVTALAPNQTALLKVTDMASGAYRQSSFAIAQFTGNTPAFFTLPSAITFTGPFADVCASGVNASVSVHGGMPPYTIAGGSSAYSVDPTTVAASGGSFNVSLFRTTAGNPRPICVENAPIGVTDATGRTIVVTLNNVAGTGTAPATAVSVVPATLNLVCGQQASVVVLGGGDTVTLSASSDHPRISLTIADRTVTLLRTSPDPAPPTTFPTTGRITVTDGVTSAIVTVTIKDLAGATVSNCLP